MATAADTPSVMASAWMGWAERSLAKTARRFGLTNHRNAATCSARLTVAVANVNAATGHLTHQAGSPFGVGARPFDIAVVEP